MPFAFLASYCSSMSSVMNSSLNCGGSSKFVDPVHSLSNVACLFVVQSSSSECTLVPSMGLMMDLLC